MVEFRISNMTQSGKESQIISIIKFDLLFLNTATPPRGDLDTIGFDLPIRAKFSGHFERILKCDSTITKISQSLMRSIEKSDENLFRTPLTFQKHNFMGRLRSERLDVNEKTGSGQ